jgi:acyl-CoA dehydrogenase
MAAQDIRALPKLEGTVHVNMALIVKFMANYFFNPDTFSKISPMHEPQHDDFLFNQGPTRGLSKIRFHDYNLAYDTVDSPNIRIFKTQIAALKTFLATAAPDGDQQKDIDFLLTLGELFTLVAYGQLIIENSAIHQVPADLLDQIFDFMVRDFSAFALALHLKPSSTTAQMAASLNMIQKPENDPRRFESVWQTHVAPLNGAYEMKP